MTSNKKERNYIGRLFGHSWHKTRTWKQQTIFETFIGPLHPVGVVNIITAEPIFKKIETHGLFGTEVSYLKIGTIFNPIKTDSAFIYTKKEALIDVLENERELIHTRLSRRCKLFQWVRVTVTKRLKVALGDIASQIGALLESETNENDLLFDQILKGIISEL